MRITLATIKPDIEGTVPLLVISNQTNDRHKYRNSDCS
jgi:hypothetical protein